MRRFTVTIEMPDDYNEGTTREEELNLLNGVLPLNELLEIAINDSACSVEIKVEDI